MNEIQAFTLPVIGGFEGYLRLPKDGGPKPILNSGGRPRIFTTEIEAMRCVTQNLVRYVNGRLYRDGEVIKSPTSDADKHFNLKAASGEKPVVLKQKGKTRRITIERRKR